MSFSTRTSRQRERRSRRRKTKTWPACGLCWPGGNPILTMPRSAVIRSVVLNHIIHHRAHLCVYLRLNDIPVPGMYGPSGDERSSAVGVIAHLSLMTPAKAAERFILRSSRTCDSISSTAPGSWPLTSRSTATRQRGAGCQCQRSSGTTQPPAGICLDDTRPTSPRATARLAIDEPGFFHVACEEVDE